MPNNFLSSKGVSPQAVGKRWFSFYSDSSSSSSSNGGGGHHTSHSSFFLLFPPRGLHPPRFFYVPFHSSKHRPRKEEGRTPFSFMSVRRGGKPPPVKRGDKTRFGAALSFPRLSQRTDRAPRCLLRGRKGKGCAKKSSPATRRARTKHFFFLFCSEAG